MNTKNSRDVRRMTRGALIASLYVALTYVASIFGLSSGVIQFRISEALTILPVFMPEAIPGLFIGCIISNLMTPAVHPLDILCGSIATLIGAVLTYLLRRVPQGMKWVATLPPILANAIIVPFVLMFAYGVPGSYFYFMLTVFIGEAVCAGIGGTVLYFALRRVKFK